MSLKLEYAAPEKSTTLPAVCCFICGVSSGPVGVCLAAIASQSQIPETNKELWALAALVCPMISAIYLGIRLRAVVFRSASHRNRLLATIGLFAPIFWAAAMIGYVALVFYCISTQSRQP